VRYKDENAIGNNNVYVRLLYVRIGHSFFSINMHHMNLYDEDGCMQTSFTRTYINHFFLSFFPLSIS